MNHSCPPSLATCRFTISRARPWTTSFLAEMIAAARTTQQLTRVVGKAWMSWRRLVCACARTLAHHASRPMQMLLAPRALFGADEDGGNDVFYASELGKPGWAAATTPAAAGDAAAPRAADAADQRRRASPVLVSEVMRERVPVVPRVVRAAAPAAAGAESRRAGPSDTGRHPTQGMGSRARAGACPYGDIHVAEPSGAATHADSADLRSAVAATLERLPIGLIGGGDPWAGSDIGRGGPAEGLLACPLGGGAAHVATREEIAAARDEWAGLEQAMRELAGAASPAAASERGSRRCAAPRAPSVL